MPNIDANSNAVAIKTLKIESKGWEKAKYCGSVLKVTQ
jgi:hypothetical protein